MTSILALGAGVRLPLSREATRSPGQVAQVNHPATTGLTAHFEQVEAYLPNTAALAFHARFELPISETPFAVRLQASPVLLYDVTDASQRFEGDSDRVQGTLAYGVQAFATAGPARIGGGLVGRRYVVDPQEIGDSANTTALRLEAAIAQLPLQPSLSARIPLSGPKFSDAIVSLSLTVPVR